MDPWRRKLHQMNEAKRPRWPARAHDPAIAKWGKAALVCAAIAAVWFLLRDDTLRLDAGETAVPVPSLATDSTMTSDPYELYRRQQYEAALPLLLTQAEAGFSLAQCMAGKILAEGRGGVSPDRIEAAKWLDLCVRDPDQNPETSDDEAREILDRLIIESGWDIAGEGKYRAFQWQQAFLNRENGEPGSAAESVLRDLPNLSPETAFELGVDLNEGLTHPVDFAKALEAFKHAADGGLKEAMFNVGLSYYVGKGVKPDPVEARRWLDKAADAGFAQAAMMLGVMAVRGHGMAADVDAALAYLDRADELGDPKARLLREAVAAGVIPK